MYKQRDWTERKICWPKNQKLKITAKQDHFSSLTSAESPAILKLVLPKVMLTRRDSRGRFSEAPAFSSAWEASALAAEEEGMAEAECGSAIVERESEIESGDEEREG